MDRSAWEYATEGTYTDRQLPSGAALAVVVLVFALCLLPFAGMLWAPTQATTENRELATPPQVTADDGSFNWSILADTGAYFEDHFAYRNQMVAANARLRAAAGVAATDQVVVGTDGWLYYAGTLPDYLGQAQMSERALRDAAHNLALAQSYIRAHGSDFVLLVSPNKNSLYPDHMPGYYLQSPDTRNAQRLAPLLDREGVSYVDAFALFGGTSGEWYLKRDTHWNNAGALMAAQAILAAVGHEALPVEPADGSVRDDFTGDVENMLFPSGQRTEDNWYYAGYNDGEGFSGSLWSYVEGSDVTDATILTTSSAGTGRLLMYRDSFGNALVPFMAAGFGECMFSKLVPYNLSVVNQFPADAVVIERAERNLDYFATTPFLMPSPAVGGREGLPASGTVEDAGATLRASQDGPYVVLAGEVPGLGDDADCLDAGIYVAVDGFAGRSALYDAFWTSVQGDGGAACDYGFQVNLVGDIGDLSQSTVGVYIERNGELTCVLTTAGRELL